MRDLIVGLGIALVLEGLLWALFPDVGRRMVQELLRLAERQLAVLAWTLVVSGLCLLMLARTLTT